MQGSELRDFLIKCLNMWVQNTDDQFIDVDKWIECATHETLEDYRGKSCFVGLDLSSGGDLTTISLEFEKEKESTIGLYLKIKEQYAIMIERFKRFD